MAPNRLSRFPSAILRRGMAHIHPAARGIARRLDEAPGWLIEAIVPPEPAAPRGQATPAAEEWPA